MRRAFPESEVRPKSIRSRTVFPALLRGRAQRPPQFPTTRETGAVSYHFDLSPSVLVVRTRFCCPQTHGRVAKPRDGKDQHLLKGKRPIAFYSITSSARVSNVDGTARPSTLAVLRLMTSSNLVGC